MRLSRGDPSFSRETSSAVLRCLTEEPRAEMVLIREILIDDRIEKTVENSCLKAGPKTEHGGI